MEGEGHSPPFRMPVVMAVASLLSLERETVSWESGDDLAGGEGAQVGVVDHPTLTATVGLSETVTFGGSGSPSSRSSSITICTTSWMFLNASSLVFPQLAAPRASSSGT